MKRWFSIQIIIVFAVAMFGQVSKAQFTDCGILGIENIENTYKIDCELTFIFGNNPNTGDTEKNIYNNLLINEDDYVNNSELAPIVIIGHSTGNLANYADSIGQEIIVDKIIKGSDIEEGQKYYVYCVDSFALNNNNKVVYTGLKNLMDPACSYLIFLDPSELNEISQKNVYCLYGSFFSYLNLSRDVSYAISEPIDKVKYSEVKESEFFAGSQRIVDQINIIKKRIISKYIEK